MSAYVIDNIRKQFTKKKKQTNILYITLWIFLAIDRNEAVKHKQKEFALLPFFCSSPTIRGGQIANRSVTESKQFWIMLAKR